MTEEIKNFKLRIENAMAEKIDIYERTLKEAREAQYWLRLLLASESIRAARIKPLLQEASEIVAILTTIAKKTNPRNPPRLHS